MFSNQQERSTNDINMIEDIEFDQFDDCLDGMEDLEEDADITFDFSRRNSLVMGCDPSIFERRHSLIGAMNTNPVEYRMSSTSMPTNEYRECYEHFNSNNMSSVSPSITRSKDNYEASDLPMDIASDEFKKTFKRTMMKLEESMRRSEQSRRMLGDQRSSFITATTFANNNDTCEKGRSQLLSYFSQLGNKTI